ncbi:MULTISPECIES: hypothetical protein [unclassified Rhizobium]|nr:MULTISPECIES: hypothetical protein [unclassified Rhizobium]
MEEDLTPISLHLLEVRAQKSAGDRRQRSMIGQLERKKEFGA